MLHSSPTRAKKRPLGPLASAGVRVRQRGAEHAPLGTYFDYRQTQINDLYRQPRKGGVLSHRCYRCSTEDGMGLTRSTGRARTEVHAGPCPECDRVAIARQARLAELLREEEEMRLREERSIQRRRAKKKRQDYSNMFKPAALKPLNRGSLASSGDTDGDESDSDESSSDEEVLLPPPKQLDSLLPLSIGSKKEFISVIKGYRKHRRKLERLRDRAERDRKRKQEEERQRTADSERAAQNEKLIRGALAKLANRQKHAAFAGWRANVKFQKRLKMLTRLSSTRLLDLAWRAWRQVARDAKIERYCSTVYIQSFFRKMLACRRAQMIRHQWQAASMIQRFVRAMLAKNVASLARRKRLAQERLIAQSLLRLCDNRMRDVLFAWKNHVNLMRKVRIMALLSSSGKRDHFFRLWKRNAVSSRRNRTLEAIDLLQRIGRGMVGRINARQARAQRDAAICIQNMARCRFARDRMRLMLRQRRAFRRKLKAVLGKEKEVRFRRWKTVVRQKKVLRIMIEGSKVRMMRFFMERWVERRVCALDLQRVFRGFQGRLAAKRAKENLLSEMAKFGCGSPEERERLERLLDPRFQSSFLTHKRHDLLMVKRLGLVFRRRKELAGIKAAEQAAGNAKKASRKMFVWELGRKRNEKRMLHTREMGADPALLVDAEELEDEVLNKFSEDELLHPDEIVMDVHGQAKQRFVISTHASFLEEIIAKEIEREIEKLSGEEQFQRQVLKAEAEQWNEMLHRFLGKGKQAHLADFRSYHKAGKSFDITITTHEEARETIAAWKEMFDLQYITRWTILSWIAEGLLMKKKTRIAQRIIVWEVLSELFERALMEDLAALILARYQESGV